MSYERSAGGKLTGFSLQFQISDANFIFGRYPSSVIRGSYGLTPPLRLSDRRTKSTRSQVPEGPQTSSLTNIAMV